MAVSPWTEYATGRLIDLNSCVETTFTFLNLGGESRSAHSDAEHANQEHTDFANLAV
jgi:hypothetical protein